MMGKAMQEMELSASLTIAECLAESLRGAAKSYHQATEEAPVCVLWTDPDCSWKTILPTMHKLLPELLMLGKYKPEERQGPIFWLKCALAGKIATFKCQGKKPILYLPKVSRRHLQDAKQCSESLQPLVELLYRGVAWTQKNGKDWSAESFFRSKEGLGLDVSKKESTCKSLRFALNVLASKPVSQLSNLTGRRLDERDFDAIVVNDLHRDLLLWIGQRDDFKAKWGEGRWHAFCSRACREFKFHPEKEEALFVAERLGMQKDEAWQKLWERFCEAPIKYKSVRDVLFRVQPSEVSLNPKTWPRENHRQENALRKVLESLSEKSDEEARLIISKAENEHGKRRDWVWAQLGEAPLAEALKALNQLSEATRFIPTFEKIDEFADWYDQLGCQADAAVLEALRRFEDEDQRALTSAICAIYEPWLHSVCLNFQSLIKGANPFFSPPPFFESQDHNEDYEDGECILFVDGLRLDIAKWLSKELDNKGCEVRFKTRFAALPTITATAKPAVSPIADLISGDRIPDNFQPNDPEGKPLTYDRFRKCLREKGYTILDSKKDIAPSSEKQKAWCEVGKIDSLGHKLGIGLARSLPDEVARIAKFVNALLKSGWKAVRIVSDHGWLLLPGGLKKHPLPEFLVESRWTRCAIQKGESSPDVPSISWRWNRAERVLIAPGASAFLSATYSHGGVSPQECVIPDLKIVKGNRSLETHPPRIVKLRWRRMRCYVEVEDAFLGLLAELRTDWNDPSTRVCEQPKEVENDGQVSLLIIDEDLEGKFVFVVLIDHESQLLSKSETRVGHEKRSK